eukprot:4447833-Lingulodinium_polyedra.AAC.1
MFRTLLWYVTKTSAWPSLAPVPSFGRRAVCAIAAGTRSGGVACAGHVARIGCLIAQNRG